MSKTPQPVTPGEIQAARDWLSGAAAVANSLRRDGGRGASKGVCDYIDRLTRCTDAEVRNFIIAGRNAAHPGPQTYVAIEDTGDGSENDGVIWGHGLTPGDAAADAHAELLSVNGSLSGELRVEALTPEQLTVFRSGVVHWALLPGNE